MVEQGVSEGLAVTDKQRGGRLRTGVLIGLVLMALVGWAARPAHADRPSAPGLIGYWTLEHNEGVVQIYSCGWQTLCGALVGIELDHPGDRIPKTWNGQSQCDYVFITKLRARGDAWFGRITNPMNGHSYGARLSLASPGILKLRGYFLIQSLGETQTWTRFPGIPPVGCRLSPGAFSAAGS